MIERLTRELRPERACEEEVLDAAAALPNAELLVELVERATKREFLRGAEAGREEIEEELGLTRRPW